MKIHAISQVLPQARYQRCPQCDTLFSLPTVKSSRSAYCPRCDAKVHHGRDWSLTRLAAMAVAMLLLMPVAFSEQLLRIYLTGTKIDANVFQGIWQITSQGNPLCQWLLDRWPDAVEIVPLNDLFPEAKKAITPEGFLHIFPQLYD